MLFRIPVLYKRFKVLFINFLVLKISEKDKFLISSEFSIFFFKYILIINLDIYHLLFLLILLLLIYYLLYTVLLQKILNILNFLVFLLLYY